MTGCIAGSQYIPSIEYFAHWMQNGLLTMEKHEHFQKRTWRNKSAILSPEKPLFLTVPLKKGKHQQMMIDDVTISYDEPWPKIHFSALQAAYGKSAYFDEIGSGLESILFSEMKSLWDLNLSLLQLITDLLPGEWPVASTSQYHRQYLPPVFDLRYGVPAGTSSIGDGAYPVYMQVQRLHKAHLPNLSILDALCHLGPETYSYLATYASKLYENQ